MHLILAWLACSGTSPDPVESAPRADTSAPTPRFVDRTAEALPPLVASCMDAAPVDVDDDGDLDLVLAQEFRENVLLLNDGQGTFSDASDQLPRTRRDSEDLAVGDIDGDDDPDVFIVSEDDRANELYLNDGAGNFTAASDQIPVEGVSNGVVAIPLNDDDRMDVVIGNAGANTALLGGLPLVDVTAARLPETTETTQDLEAGDVDGDGDLDLVVANEGDNVLWRNEDGVFTAEPDAIELREAPEESREAELGDVDGDGDLDLVFGNIRFLVGGADRANRLLLNDGTGRFTTSAALPADDDDTFDVELLDLDADGDLELVTANLDSLSGSPANRRYRVYDNDGKGVFTLATGAFFPDSARGNGFDIEGADFTGDGVIDVFLCSRGGQDRLLVGAAK